MNRLIYADNAATTRMDEDVVSAMIPYMHDLYGNASQPYFLGIKAKKAINAAREDIASCLGAFPEEIYFTSGGTESDNWAIKGSGDSSDHRIVITSCIEHHAVLNACADLPKCVTTIRLPVDKKGVVSCDDLKKSLESLRGKNESVLVSVMMANNEIGTIQPIGELTRIAHSYGAVFHTDAVQAVGHVCCDVSSLGIDMLSASAHKFNGPKGIGFLYVKKGTKIKPYINGGSQENGMRAGTENVASIVGMATALKLNVERLHQHEKYLLELEEALLRNLREAGIDFIRNGSENHIPGNVNLSFSGCDGEMLLHRLDLKGICISTGSACDSENHQLSHVVKAINVNEKYAYGTIRISLGKNNSIQDVVTIADEIVNVIRR